MKRVVDLIEAQAADFPHCAYYLEIVRRAETELEEAPNICIETCKSLLEGISKTILLKTRKDYTPERVENMKFKSLVEAAITDLRDNDDVIEDGFKRSVTDLSNWLGILRNHRGEISHGRASPKLKESTDKLALLCLHTTEAIAYYMLDSYFNLEEQAQEGDNIDEQEEGSQSYILDVEYAENSAFNDWLDQANPLPGKLLYSEALYELYIEDYLIALKQFNDTDDADEVDEEG